MKRYAVLKTGNEIKVNVFRNKKELDDWLNSADGWLFKKASCFNIVISLMCCIINVVIMSLRNIFLLVMLLIGCILNCLTGGFSVNIRKQLNQKEATAQHEETADAPM